MSIAALTADLRDYIHAQDLSVIVGHSMGSLVVLSLVPALTTPTPVLLVDPGLELSDTLLARIISLSTDSMNHAHRLVAGVDLAPPSAWSHQDTARNLYAALTADPAVPHAIARDNSPWSFVHLLRDAIATTHVTILIADPALTGMRTLDAIRAAGIDPDAHPRLRIVPVPDVGHWVQYERPDLIVEELRRIVDQSGEGLASVK